MNHLVDLLCLCLLCLTGKTLCDKKEPPLTVKEDSDVVLPCSLSTKENIQFKLFVWKKASQKDEGLKEVFQYDKGIHYNNGQSGQSEEFKGRVSHFQDELKHGNASIIIRNTKISDSGNYSCDFPNLQPRQTFYIKLVVEPKVRVTVGHGSDVVLPCSLSTKDNIEFKLFDWRKVAQKDEGQKEVFLYDAGIHYNNGRGGQSEEFKGRVSHFQDELKHGNASIIIRNTKMSDNGVYSCYFPNLKPPQKFYIKLVVVDAAPKPHVSILDQTEDRSLLQCEVHGYPEPEVEWRDSAGNTLPAQKPQVEPIGNLFYITLRTTVTKADHYRCVATQETINHQVSNEIPVYFSGLSTGWIMFIVLAVAVVVAVFINVAGVIALMLLVNKGYITLHHKKEFSTGSIVLIVSLALVAGVVVGVVALMVLVKMGYITLQRKKRTEVITVKEGSDVILPFHLWPKEDLTLKVFTWKKRPEEEGGIQKNVFLYDKGVLNKGQRVEVKGQDEQFRGRVNYFQEELKEGNASIIIKNTLKADSGDYFCFHLDPQNPQMFKVKLVVASHRRHHSAPETNELSLMMP